MSHDLHDDQSLIPSDLDLENLKSLEVDGRMEAENGSWLVLRYPDLPYKGWRWCQYTLIVNHPDLSGHPWPYELKNVGAVVEFLKQLEGERKTKQ